MSTPHAMEATSAIRATALTKRYPEVTAVDALDLVVHSGEIYGFLGRNGAGKTTMIRMLLGLVRPTSGSVQLFGADISRDRRAALRSVGSLVETATAYPNLTVRENLEIQRTLTSAGPDSVERAIALLQLNEYADRRSSTLSLGNRQRLALARALLASPRLVVLDEPANGLDPAGIVEIRTLLQRMRDEIGMTVFVSSHILSEIDLLADRIGIIHRGRLVQEVDLRADRNRSAEQRVRVSFTTLEHPGAQSTDVGRAAIGNTPPFEHAYRHLAAARRILGQKPGVHDITEVGHAAVEFLCDSAELSEILRSFVVAGIPVTSFCPRREDLETWFLRLTGGGE